MIAYGWRKYEVAVVLRPPLVAGDGLWLLRVEDDGSYPALNRWAGLEACFAGFVGQGTSPPHAVAYWLSAVLEAANQYVHDTHVEWHDRCERLFWVESNLRDVWFGERTPYLVSESENWPLP